MERFIQVAMLLSLVSLAVNAWASMLGGKSHREKRTKAGKREKHGKIENAADKAITADKAAKYDPETGVINEHIIKLEDYYE